MKAYYVKEKELIRLTDLDKNQYNGLQDKVIYNDNLSCYELPIKYYDLLDQQIEISKSLQDYIDIANLDIPGADYWNSLIKDITLRPFQVEFLQWYEGRKQLAFYPVGKQQSVICSLCCGAGKSIVSMIIDAHLRKQGLVSKTLILCKNNNKSSTWGYHLEEYYKLPFIYIEGSAKERTEAIKDFKSKRFKIGIIHYEAIRKHAEDLVGIADHIIIDECQMITNPKSQQAVAANIVTKPTKYILQLSGGVAENKIATQLWHPLHLCQRTFWSSFQQWKNNWCTTEQIEVPFIAKGGRRIINRSTGKTVMRTINQITGIKDPEELAKYVSLYMFQKDFYEIASQLPKVTHQTWEVKLSPEQKKVYMEIRESLTEEIKGLPVPSALIKTLKLLQCCSTLACLGMEDISSKADAAVEFLIEDIPEDSKVMIFSQHVAMVHSTYNRLIANGVNALMMTGETPKKQEERNEIRDRFKKDPKVRALVTTIQLESTGGSYEEANYCLMLDRVHSVLKNSQAEFRVIRATSQKPIVIVNFITSGTVEQIQMRILEQKLKNIQDVLSPADTFTKQDVEDMLNIKPV